MTDQLDNPGLDEVKRGTVRLPLPDEVTVSIETVTLRGSGENVSESGVYFIADEVVRVRVAIGGTTIGGDLVRIESHGQGRTGIAIRFDDASESESSRVDSTPELSATVDVDPGEVADAGPDNAPGAP